MNNEVKIIYVNIKDIVEYDKNPRKNDKAVKPVADSIKEFGFKVPIVLDKNNVIIAGHTRLKAAKRLKLKEVPCIIADDLNDDQAKAFRLVDNKTNEFAEWDIDLLNIELSEIELDLTPFDFKIEKTVNDIEEDEFEVVLPDEPKSKKGDIYILGNHRLMCGDSTKEDDVAKLMNGVKADMVFTDPPYLMNFTGSVHRDGSKSHNSSFGEIANDSMSRNDGDEFILSIVKMIENYVDGAYYICFYRLGIDYVLRALDSIGNKYRALIIWDKGNHTLSNSDYMSKYEPIVYGWINNHNFYGPKGEYDIWEVRRTQRNNLHPTMKPLELCGRAISNSSRVGEVVLDLFGGSGSTLIASEQLDRSCYMMELDEKYVDVIVKRYLNLTNDIEGVYLMRNGQKISLNEITDYK